MVDSGKNDSARTSTIDTYNGNSSLTYWSTDTANMINGTGELSILVVSSDENYSCKTGWDLLLS